MNIVTERSINLQMRPMINARGKVFPPIYKIFNSAGHENFTATGESRWDYNCYRLMDFLASKIKENVDKKIGEIFSATDSRLSELQIEILSNPDKVYSLKEKLDSYKKGADVKLIVVSVTQSTPREMLNSKCLEGIDRLNLDSTILKASSCKVNIPFEFKTIIDKKSKFVPFVYKNFDSFFTFEKISGEMSSDGKYYRPTYKFNFDTVLGYLFIHNIICAGCCKIEEPFYKLSNYANILFRMKFLPYSNYIKRVLYMDDILTSLNIKEPNKRWRKQFFYRLINELRDFGLITISSITDDVVICYRSKSKKVEKENKVIPFERPKLRRI